MHEPVIVRARAAEALGVVRDLLRLFSRRDKITAAGLVVLLVAAAGLETLGIGLIVPFIALFSDPNLVITDPRFASVYRHFSLTQREFVFASGIALLLLYVFKNAFLAGITHLQQRFTFWKQTRLARDLFSAYLRAPYVLHLHRNTAEIARNLTTEVNGVFVGIVSPLFALAAECLVCAAIVVFLLVIEPTITLVAVGVLGASAAVFYMLVAPRLRASSERRAQSSAAQLKWVNQSLGSLREIRILGKEQHFIDEFTRATSRYAQSARVYLTTIMMPRYFLETLAVAGMLIVVLALSLRGEPPQSAVPMLAMFAMASLRIVPSLARMMSSFSTIRFFRPALDVVVKDMALRPDPASAGGAAASRAPLAFERALELKKVWYRYPGAAAPALDALDLRIDAGSAVAIVGASGAGKSTLVDLLLGLLAPEQGEIRVDGVDVRTHLHDWQRLCGYVPQAIYLLDDSVRKNVAFGLTDAEIDDEKVWRALAAARLEEKFRASPEGLDAMVGERGVRLSGGERQRLGIARALFSEPRFLVFDEATSALDHQTEREISETIESLHEDKTVVIVAHRLTSVMHCDRIYFMQGGRISDCGTFDELASRNPEFRRTAGLAHA